MAGSSFFGSSFLDLVCLAAGLCASIVSCALFPLFLLATVAIVDLSSVHSSGQLSISEISDSLLIRAALLALGVISARCQSRGALLAPAPAVQW